MANRFVGVGRDVTTRERERILRDCRRVNSVLRKTPPTDAEDWRLIAEILAEALIAVASDAGMPMSFRQTDSRTLLAQHVLHDVDG